MTRKRVVALAVVLAVLILATRYGAGPTDRSGEPEREAPPAEPEVCIEPVPAAPPLIFPAPEILKATDGRVIRIQVVAADTGVPIAGSRAKRWDRARTRWRLLCTADGEGRFNLPIRKEKLKLRVGADGYGHLIREFTAADAEGDEVVLRLEPAHLLTGQVFRSDGTPLPGAGVFLVDAAKQSPMLDLMREDRIQGPRYAKLLTSLDSRLRQPTGPDGRFSIPLTPGDPKIMVVVTAPGFWPKLGPLVDPSGTAGKPLRIELTPGPMMRVVLRDEAGDLIDSSRIRMSAEIYPVKQTEDSQPVFYWLAGNDQLIGPFEPAGYSVHVNQQGLGYGNARVTVAPTGETVCDVTLTPRVHRKSAYPEYATVTIQLVREDGTPPSDEERQRVQTLEPRAYLYDREGRRGSARTFDQELRITLQVLAEGGQTVHVELGGRSFVLPVTDLLKDGGQQARILTDLEEDDFGKVRVRVTDRESGKPLEGAGVRIATDGKAVARAVTDADGCAEVLLWNCHGTRAMIGRAGYGHRELALAPGEKDIAVHLAPLGDLNLDLSDLLRIGFACIEITATPKSGRPQSRRVDLDRGDSALVTFMGLAPGPVEIEVRSAVENCALHLAETIQVMPGAIVNRRSSVDVLGRLCVVNSGEEQTTLTLTCVQGVHPIVFPAPPGETLLYLRAGDYRSSFGGRHRELTVEAGAEVSLTIE